MNNHKQKPASTQEQKTLAASLEKKTLYKTKYSQIHNAKSEIKAITLNKANMTQKPNSISKSLYKTGTGKTICLYVFFLVQSFGLENVHSIQAQCLKWKCEGQRTGVYHFLVILAL